MRNRTIVIVFGLTALTGCPDGKPQGDLPPLHPAKGTVVRKGIPVAGGMVRFQPQPDVPDLIINSVVGADGTFDLQTLHAVSQKKAPGAPAGTYKVTYHPDLGDQTKGGNPVPVTPAATFTIKDGPNELTIELGKK